MMLPPPFASWPDASALPACVAGFVPAPQQPVVQIAAPCLHRYRIVPVGRAARWFERAGLTRRLRSGDRAFDERWSVETDDVEFGEALMRLPAARDAVSALAGLGGWAITQDRKRLTVVLVPKERTRLKEPERKRAVEASLHVLAGLSAELLRSRNFPRRRGSARLFAGILLGAAALLVPAFAFSAHWSKELVEGETGMLALRSLLVGLPVGLAVLVAAMVPLAGRSTSHRELGGLVVLLLPAVLLACFAASLAANRFLDPGPATQHRVPVLERNERRHEKKLTGYWVHVPDWHGGAPGATRRIRFDTETGRCIVAGRSMLVLSVSPGRFGAERLLSISVEAEPER